MNMYYIWTIYLYFFTSKTIKGTNTIKIHFIMNILCWKLEMLKKVWYAKTFKNRTAFQEKKYISSCNSSALNTATAVQASMLLIYMILQDDWPFNTVGLVMAKIEKLSIAFQEFKMRFKNFAIVCTNFKEKW